MALILLFVNDRQLVFTGKSMIDTFLEATYHMYYTDSKMTIKMNDTMIDLFSLCSIS